MAQLLVPSLIGDCGTCRRHSLIQSHLSKTHSIAAKSAKQFFFGSVCKRASGYLLPLAETGASRPPLKLAELIEREFGGFVPPKMFDD
jgi:hypothetical protein